jgi:hypothetical protein
MNTQPRHDIYAFIHKGLRAEMSRCLLSLSSLDAQDDDELQPVLDAVAMLLKICRTHVEHENTYVHTAMERRRPGSTRPVAHEHVEHIAEIDTLEQEALRLQRLPSLRRVEPLQQFYRRFALFMAENFVHMAKEESEHNAVLWDCYSDDEIRTIEHELVSHIAPEMMPVTLSYMVPAMTPAERANFLGAMRDNIPAEVFAGIIESIAPLLSAQHRIKLRDALQLQRSALLKTA